MYTSLAEQVSRSGLDEGHRCIVLNNKLAGLPVIRAFGQQTVFERRMQHAVDDQNVSESQYRLLTAKRAAFITVSQAGTSEILVIADGRLRWCAGSC